MVNQGGREHSSTDFVFLNRLVAVQIQLSVVMVRKVRGVKGIAQTSQHKLVIRISAV